MKSISTVHYLGQTYTVASAQFTLTGGTTNNELVAAVAAKSIKIVWLLATSTAASSILLKSNNSTAITPALNLATAPLLINDLEAFGATVAGENLTANVGTANVTGMVGYITV